jgi:hypothetical protein
MVTPLEREYTVRRGDAWPGEGFRIYSPLNAAATFWSNAVVKSQLRWNTKNQVAHEFDFTGARAPYASVWRTGSGVPSNSLGAPNDYYRDSVSGLVYQKGLTEYSAVSGVSGPTDPSGTRQVLTFGVWMTPDETKVMVPGQYVGDIEVLSNTFPKSTLIEFDFDLVADVTR